MKVLILGASGLIGGNLLKLLKGQNTEVVGTYFSYQAKDCVYFNTLNPDDPINEISLNEWQPDVIVHCGALTWVDYCEEHVEESFEKTVISTSNALEIAKQLNSKLVYISTDYVFDGVNGPYTEAHEVNPVSVYGKHKLEAEQLVIHSGIDHLICRVTNVYGEEERNKNFIARLLETVSTGEQASFTFPIDQIATPINAWDVARAVDTLLKAGKNGIYHLASTDLLNRFQLANIVLKYFNDHKIELKPVLTSEMNQAAARPLFGGLIPTKFLQEFPTFEFSNVDDYIKQHLKR